MSIRLNESDLTKISRNAPASEKIKKILINGNRSDRYELLQTLYASKNKQYLDLIREIMLFDDDPIIRTLCFHIVATFGDREDVEDLIEVIVLEQDEKLKNSLLDMFKRYLKNNNIEVKNISQVSFTETEDSLKQETEQEPEIKVDNYLPIFEDPAKKKILNYIYDMTPEIPISVHRMSQILRINVNSLNSYLQEFVNNHPDAAKYLEFEQVFIKKEKTIRKLIDGTQIKSQLCRNCSESTSKFPCEHCEEGIQCVTCRLTLGMNENSLQCPNCKALSHKKHILEWLKIKGQCPNCKEKLQAKDLIVET